MSNQERHRVVVEEDFTIDIETNPEAPLLLNLEQENNLCCSVLDLKSFNEQQLRLNAPKIVTHSTLVVTRPQILEQVKAVARAKSAGRILQITGGKHLNSDDFLKS